MIIEKLENIIANSKSPKEAVSMFQLEFGGNRVYVPALTTDDRNRKIKEAFKGNNHREVCDTFGISLSTLWRIIR